MYYNRSALFLSAKPAACPHESGLLAWLSTLADADRLGRTVGVLLLRRGGKQQLAQLENRLRDCEVAQFRWWAWASRYRRRKVCIFSYGMSILSTVSVGIAKSSASALSAMALYYQRGCSLLVDTPSAIALLQCACQI